MEFHQPLGTFRTKEKLQCVLRRRLRWCQRIKRRIRSDLEMFTSSLIFRWSWRNHLQQRFRQLQRLRLQRSQHRGQRTSLLCRRNNLRRRLPIAAQRKRIIHSPNQFASRLHLIPVQQENRYQRIFNRRQRRAFTNIRFSKSSQSRCTHLHQTIQLIHRVRARIPQMSYAARGTRRPRILICQIPQPPPKSIQQNLAQRRALIRARRKFAVSPCNRNFIPLANPRSVRIRNIRHSIRAQFHHRRRIIHHRRPIHCARRIVVHQPQRVPHLMRRQLPQPRQRHLLRRILTRGILPSAILSRGQRFAVRVWRQQSLRNQIILPHPQRSQRYVPFDDFSRARIGHRRPIRPSPRRPMNPLDHVVAQIHRVRTLRHQLHAKRMLESRRFERLRPPPRPLQQRRPNWLRRPAIQIIDNRLRRLTHRRRRILLLQPVPRRKSLHNRFADRRRIIHVRNPEKARPRIVSPRLVPRRRQLHQRVMLPHRDRIRLRSHLLHPLPRLFARKRQRRLHLRVQRETFRSRQVQRASRSVQVIIHLLRFPQRRRSPMRATQEKICCVHERSLALLSRHGEPPQLRLRKRNAHRPPLVRILAHRAIFHVRLHQQHFRPAPFEPHHMRPAQLPAVQPNIIRTNSRRHR